jgi:putative redox protein
MQFKKFEFINASGQKLSARLDLPLDGKPVAYALFAHCFTCSKNLKAIAHISRALTRESVAVVRFDFTGLGESEGEFGDTTFSSNVEDLVAASQFMEKNFEAPRILIGHSFGGAAVLQAAANIPSSVAVVTIASPADPGHVKHTLGSTKEKIESRGEAEVNLAGRTFKIKKQFLDDLKFVNMQETLRHLNRALLIFHSPIDDIVGIENAARIFQAARHPKSFISLDQADHLLSDVKDSRYVGTVIAAWALKYINGPQKDKPPKNDTQHHVMTSTGPSGYLTDIMVNNHGLVADEPIALGGTNLGPTPFEYLTAALGACTSMTLRIYADRKEWPLESVKVRLNHKKIPAIECETCETNEGMVDHFEREIEVEGPLDDAQLKRLTQIADRCPVHRALKSEILITTELKKELEITESMEGTLDLDIKL